MKICKNCKEEKNLIEFYKNKRSKDNLDAICTICMKTKNKLLYEKHKEGRLLKAKKYYQDNIETIKQNVKEYTKNNKEKIKIRDKKYKKLNAEYYKSLKKKHIEKDKISYNKKRALYIQKKRKYDIPFKLLDGIRNRLNKILNQSKKVSSKKSIGCSFEELKLYLESKFQPGMSWENHGTHGWHIDHIIPLSSFDLTDKEQLLKACHYTNLQPLWAKDNLRKGANFE